MDKMLFKGNIPSLKIEETFTLPVVYSEDTTSPGDLNCSATVVSTPAFRGEDPILRIRLGFSCNLFPKLGVYEFNIMLVANRNVWNATKLKDVKVNIERNATFTPIGNILNLYQMYRPVRDNFFQFRFYQVMAYTAGVVGSIVCNVRIESPDCNNEWIQDGLYLDVTSIVAFSDQVYDFYRLQDFNAQVSGSEISLGGS